YRDGRKIGTQVMRTAGKPVAVRLTPDPYNGKPAIGDVQFFQVDVVDVNGTRDPLATNRVSFRLMGSGVLAAVGNGNPRGYDAFTKTDSHPLYFGKAVVAVRRTGPGVITLTAEAEGLGASTLQWLDC
ncbi:MAG: glycoside hydrolase family 2, partial [Kiritimatiellae bacterium]|nr:glycoside hydrolase family 2 [Kiritimatiellia bacterium]